MILVEETFLAWAAKWSLSVDKEQVQQMDQYAKLLLEWNEKMNLTAITDPEAVAIKHFLDSLLLLDAIKLQQGARIIDVGTGAGFPAVPCLIVRSDLSVTLLDSLNKRINFLNEVCTNLNLKTALIHARAEEAGQKTEFREHYDLATARAVAHLRELSEYCLPFVRKGGWFAAMKGPDIEEELEQSRNAIGIMGGALRDVRKYELPDGSKRTIVLIEKISQTPSKYPRPSAKIAKFGL